MSRMFGNPRIRDILWNLIFFFLFFLENILSSLHHNNINILPALSKEVTQF